MDHVSECEHQSHEVTMIKPDSIEIIEIDSIVNKPIQMDFNKLAAKLDVRDPISPI